MMLDKYFNGFRMRFSINGFTTDWINLDIGIAMGCTIYLILFVMHMEVTLKAAEKSAVPAKLGSDCDMPRRAFMVDTTVICSNKAERRQIFVHLDG